MAEGDIVITATGPVWSYGPVVLDSAMEHNRIREKISAYKETKETRLKKWDHS